MYLYLPMPAGKVAATMKAVSVLRMFAIIPQRKRRSSTTQYVPDLRVAKAGWGLPVALLLVFPASTLQRKKPLQCHRFPRAREGLLARETHRLPPTCQNTNPGAPLQSASCRRQAALPRTRAALFHEAEQLRFPSSLFGQMHTKIPFCALSALPSLQRVFENFLKRNFGIFLAL